MRKDVRTARTLVIRKLTRHMTQLKAKKGTADAICKNQKRAERLLEEIHALKDLRPDEVSKTALQGNLSFEKICKKPNCTVTERAIARLASHPLVSKKIAAIKVAVDAFKDSRHQQKEKEQDSCNKPDVVKEPVQQAEQQLVSPNEATKVKPTKLADGETVTTAGEQILAIKERKCELETLNRENRDKDSNSVPQAAKESTMSQEVGEENRSISSQTLKEPQVAAETQPTKSVEDNTINLDITNNLESSSDEEKEYFDDSTEERFYNQSSSDDDSSLDDFFIGKVKRTKKKKQEGDTDSEINTEEQGKKTAFSSVRKANIAASGTADKNKNTSKRIKLESVFCTNLSSKAAELKRSHQTNTKFNRAAVVQRNPPNKHLPARGGARERPGVMTSRTPQSLHPSWEASKRRKAQAQIQAFQGTKIRFDDD
ncbi:serum response factor-binding protein 1 isoform X1 [Callorhinchus milii]|uniref:Serum response factor-binding protein 1 n=1 Tax=Callorhinchus milii TaxID=7868 RepID=A0A4W3J5A2_CALMI|nr:serum response factor-binding protein 1 isoform X1 [Callorhinchus milii]|eukprot:gi/632962782/ref/XP_007897516.1/ PREDICTED: serum response factor-binding protein 1 [Callorhinchus milii]